MRPLLQIEQVASLAVIARALQHHAHPAGSLHLKRAVFIAAVVLYHAFSIGPDPLKGQGPCSVKRRCPIDQQLSLDIAAVSLHGIVIHCDIVKPCLRHFDLPFDKALFSRQDRCALLPLIVLLGRGLHAISGRVMNNIDRNRHSRPRRIRMLF